MKVLDKKESDAIILDYVPKDFPIVVSQETSEFVSAQSEKNSDFQISEVVSEQVGITDLKKKKLEAKLEEELLENLKGVEEKAYQEAYELGLIEGEKKAYEEKSSFIEERLKVLDEFLDNTQNLYKKLYDKNEELLIKALYSFASKIALMEIKNRPEEIINIVAQTMEYIQGDIRSHVIISESDKEFLDQIRKHIRKEFEFIEKVEVSSSENLSQGSCVVETNFGEIDASIEERIDKVWQSISEKLPKVEGDIISTEGEE